MVYRRERDKLLAHWMPWLVALAAVGGVGGIGAGVYQTTVSRDVARQLREMRAEHADEAQGRAERRAYFDATIRQLRDTMSQSVRVQQLQQGEIDLLKVQVQIMKAQDQAVRDRARQR